MNKNLLKQRPFIWAASFVLALAFALVFYAFTTPLGPSIGSDNAIYMTLGTALANGYAPYTDIFDHKGPLLFVLQWIPQAISGGYSTMAIFVQQVLFLFGCLLVIAEISKQFGVSALPVQLAYLALICKHTGGGNLTEEYANLFTLLGLWLMICTFKNGVPQHIKGIFLRAGALGALTAVCFLIRANNALVLCAMTLAAALMIGVKRRFDVLLCCAGGFVLGLVVIFVPVIIWLAANGALGESIYGSIIHNMMYSETGGGSRKQMLLHDAYGHAALLMAALSFFGFLVLIKKNPLLFAAGAAGACAGLLAAFISHKFYAHYLILGAPLATVGVCLLISAAKRMKKQAAACVILSVAVFSCGWLFARGQETNRWRLSETNGLDEFTVHAQELYEMVPLEERDRFMAYRAEPKWYVAAEALPCMRFFFLQETLAQADPAVMDEIVDTFEMDPPKWLVIYYNREFGPPYDARVAEIFASEYEFVDARGQYQLLKHKDE